MRLRLDKMSVEEQLAEWKIVAEAAEQAEMCYMGELEKAKLALKDILLEGLTTEQMRRIATEALCLLGEPVVQECCTDSDCCEQSNSYVAECGLKFDTYEGMAHHNGKHHGPC